MPWDAASARKHDRKAVGKKGERWAAIANSVLKRTGDEASAIRQASGVIKRGVNHAANRKK